MRSVRQLRARVRALEPFRADLLLAVALAVATEIDLAIGPLEARALVVSIASAAVANLALAWRRRAPVRAAGAWVGTGALDGALGGHLFADDGPELIVASLLVAAASLGRYSGSRYAAAELVAFLGLLVAALSIHHAPKSVDDLLWLTVLCGLPWLAGRAVRQRSQLRRELEDKALRLEHERSDHARLAVQDERARIARELHAVVVHDVSTMVVQAGAARRTVRADPARARETFGSVERTGREALAEMRRLLGVLRREEEALALAPQPSLEHVDALVEHARLAGLPVSLRTEGDRGLLQPGVELALYRVVQEALTNALDSPEATRASVTILYRASDLEVRIRDDRPRLNGGGGDGFVRMRERVALYGGELTVAQSTEGGVLVRARIPRQDADP